MFSRTVFKSICTAALTAGLLSSCALFERDADGEPSHSWVEGKNYYSYGDKDATLATVAYSQGDFKTAEQHVARALTNNPRHPQALMVGALVYEELGRPNRARQYYEDLIRKNSAWTFVPGKIRLGGGFFHSRTNPRRQ